MVLLWRNFPHTSVMNQYHALIHDIALRRSVGVFPPHFHDGLNLFATMGAEGPYCNNGVNLKLLSPIVLVLLWSTCKMIIGSLLLV